MSTNALRVAGISTSGINHLRAGIPCQDSCGWFAADDTIAVAVADGAGTASHSQIGSTVAVRSTLFSLLFARTRGEELTESELELRLHNAWQAAKATIEQESFVIGTSSNELACTLLIAIGTKNGIIGAAQTGDGAVVVGQRNGQVAPLTMPASGEHLNETTFITSSDASEHLQVEIRKGVTHFALLTDGLQMISLQMPKGVPHSPFFTPLFKMISSLPEEESQAALESFLGQKRITDRTDDDLTLVVASLGSS